MPMTKLLHLRGDTNEIEVPIHGNEVVQNGELLFVAQDGNCIVGAATDFYGYPASKLAGVTPTYWEYHLLGITMKGSKSGVTEDIPVATSGIFRGDVNTGLSATSQAIRVGQTVAGSSVGASGVSLSGVSVCVGTDGDHDSGRIGRCVKHQNAALTCDFMLMTMLSGNSMTAS